MDQDTRNTLQRATQQIRNLLETEFAEQLEQVRLRRVLRQHGRL